VTIDQNVDVRIDVGEHSPHHVALALMPLAPHQRAGGAGDLAGAVRGVVVVDVDRGLGQRGAKIGDHVADGSLFVEARHKDRNALTGMRLPVLGTHRNRFINSLRSNPLGKMCVCRTCRVTIAFLCSHVLAFGTHSGARLLAVIVPFESPSPATIDRLSELVSADMDRVNTTILSRTGSQVAMIPEVANHLISSGGKRLRPMLTLAMARLAGYPGSGHVKLAAAVEFMHTATLLHDDVVDESEMRRGKLAARMLWGNEA